METKGEDATASDTTTESTEDELISSCEKADREAILRLIEAGVDINYQTWYSVEKMIVLFKTQSKNHPAWYYIEVDRGKQWRFDRDNGKRTARNPEFYGRVVKQGDGVHPDEDVQEEMNEYKSSLARDKTERDLTVLHVSVLHGQLEIAEILLNNGADPTIKDKFGYSPVELAASKGDIRMMELFQRKGLLKDRQRVNQIAADNEHRELLDYLRHEDLKDFAKRLVTEDVQAFVQGLLPITQNQSSEHYNEIGRNPKMREKEKKNIIHEFSNLDQKVKQCILHLEEEEKGDSAEVRPSLAETDIDPLALKVGSSIEEQPSL